MSLPDHYPFPDASGVVVRSWITADPISFEQVRQAAPWLGSEREIAAYMNGLRDGLAGRPLQTRNAE